MFQSRLPKNYFRMQSCLKKKLSESNQQSLGRRQPIAQSCLDTWHLLLAVSGSFLLLPFQQCQLYILPPSQSFAQFVTVMTSNPLERSFTPQASSYPSSKKFVCFSILNSIGCLLQQCSIQVSRGFFSKQNRSFEIEGS